MFGHFKCVTPQKNGYRYTGSGLGTIRNQKVPLVCEGVVGAPGALDLAVGYYAVVGFKGACHRTHRGPGLPVLRLKKNKDSGLFTYMFCLIQSHLQSQSEPPLGAAVYMICAMEIIKDTFNGHKE